MATSGGSYGRADGSALAEDVAGLGNDLSKKRKPDGVIGGRKAGPPDSEHTSAKKVKLGEALDGLGHHGKPHQIPSDRSALPVKIWLHIFSFCPPRTLGNLLCVNKLFNSCLDPSSQVTAKKPLPTLFAAKTMTPQMIWQNARRSFWPNMPGPLENKSELDMWRLSCSSTCEFCGRRDKRQALPATDPLRFGPGSDGVAPIWAFRVRCCGNCLVGRSMKEMEFLLSEGSSFLMPALPFIFATPDPCLIPLSIIDSGQLPPVSLSKLFWTADVESLRQEFASAKELGAPAVEEWQKGLSTRGADQRANIAKWEKYAESGGVTNMRTLLYPGHRPQPPLPVAQTSGNDFPFHPLRPMENVNDTSHPATKNVVPKASMPTVSKADSMNLVHDGDNGRQGTAGQNTYDTKEATDADWDEIQGPVRLKILKYADEAIIGDWDDGEKVNMLNAPSFAADVLLHVRNRFYRQVEKDAADALASGRKPIVDPPRGPFTQKLTLENMKYVFDVKVKPITEKIRKELFLCNICDYESRFFGFEGVVQHYASKHTTALSVGNVVVFWRAEWPEESPFKPNPRKPKTKSAHPLPANPARLKPLPESRRPNIKQVSPPGAPNSLPRPPFQAAPQQQSHLTAGPGRIHGVPPYGMSSAAPEPYPMFGSSHLQVGSFAPSHLPTTQPSDFQTPWPSSQPGPSLAPAAGRTQLPDNGASFEKSGAAYPAPHAVQLERAAKWAGELWQSTAEAEHMPMSLRLYAIIYHLDKRFRLAFLEALPLELFIDVLSKTEALKPMRNINALLCRTCLLGLEQGSAKTTEPPEFSLLQLAHHFQSTHATRKKKGKNSPLLDWTTDMLFVRRQHLHRDMLRLGDALFLQEAVDHLMGRRTAQQIADDHAHNNTVVGPDDNYSPQYNVASLSLPQASVPQTWRDEESSRFKLENATQLDRNGRYTRQRQREPDVLGIEGTRTAQEPEKPEEGERRQEEAIRAMWAADRVQAAQAQSSALAPSKTKRTTKEKTRRVSRDNDQTSKARLRTENVVFKEEKRNTPVFRDIPMVPKSNVPVAAEESDLLNALETHLDQAQEREVPAARGAAPIRRPHADPAVYVDEWSREGVVPHERHLHQAIPYKGERRAQYVGNPRMPEADYPRERPRSPMRQATNPQMVATMEYDANGRRSSLAEGRRYVAAEPVYEGRPMAEGELADGYARARTRPVRYHDYDRGHDGHGYEHGHGHVGYSEGVRRVAPPMEVYQPYEVVEDYEVVRVMHPEGDYFVRRPARRERVEGLPPPPPPAGWPPMAGAPPTAPSAYGADGQAVERRRDYGGEYAPPFAGYEAAVDIRGRDRALGPPDGRGADGDAVMGGYYEEEYDPRQPAPVAPNEERWPMRYQ